MKRSDSIIVTFNGSGNIYLSDDLILNSYTSLTNNITDGLEINNDLLFNGNNNALINNGTITVNNDINLGTTEGSYLINNSGGELMVGDNVGGTSFESFNIYNNGTITIYDDLKDSQSGSGASKFYNYSDL